MTGSERKVPSTAKADDRPNLGRVAVRRIGAGLRDIYDTAQAEHVPSRMRDLLEQLERTAAESSAAA